MIAVVDYGVGNLGSIVNMLRKIGVKAMVASSPADVRAAEKLILPGVGAFDSGMRRLRESGLLGALEEKVLRFQTPILGICLGLQLMTRRSEEGILPGLGWIEGEAVRFRVNEREGGLRIPHMGWNSIVVRRESNLFRGLDQEPRFYFAHSYHVNCGVQDDVLATCDHGYEFPAAVGRKNVLGTQFHPEKSHKYGMKLLKNFAECS